MTFVTLIGLAAACLTTVAFTPQVVKAWRTRSTRDISLGMFALMVWATILWLVYGIALGDVAIIISNGICLVLSATILYFKLRYK